MSNRPLFTILVPVHRPPNLLRFAIASIQAQSIAAFEVFIVCDGAPRTTVSFANELARADSRIRVFDFEKGQRFGEAHRDAALAEAAGRYVAHIADDDLWFPDYLLELSRLLSTVQFGNLIQVHVTTDDKLVVYPGDLADEKVRSRMLKSAWNFFGPSFAGYRLDAYRSLPKGWSPAPEGVYTDLFMWRKFLQKKDLRVATRFAVQGAKISAHQRSDLSIDEREAEHRRIVASLLGPQARQDFQARAYAALYAAQALEYRRRIAGLRAQAEKKQARRPPPTRLQPDRLG
jgi:glycosyltransferase involved in cell wall biosynthesis